MYALEFCVMNEISRSHMSWILYQDNEQFTLSVVCSGGGGGIFETAIKLSASEINTYSNIGDDFIDQLAKKIRLQPNKYITKKV